MSFTDPDGTDAQLEEGQKPLFKPLEIGVSHDPVHSGPFARDSSAGPDTPEVKKMAEAYEQGRPIVIYEFIQGMVDYGRNHTPPPRIFVEYKDGRRIMFDGSKFPVGGNDEIAAIEFTNSGPGMAPEDLAIFRHGGGDDTLGMHGRGTTIALAFLAKLGIKTEVRSNHRGQAWSANASLKSTETGITKVLHVDGKWGGDHSNSTVFRIENPPENLSKMVGEIGEFFLYANPKFPNAAIVPRKEEPEGKTPLRIAVDCGEVMCLDGIVEDQECFDCVFVDGLKIPVGTYSNCILPWSIIGLAEPRDPQNKVKRSHDSSSIDGYGLDSTLGLAIRNLHDEKLLKKLLSTALNDRHGRFREFSEDHSVSMSPETVNIVGEIWERDYGDALIAKTEQQKLLAEEQNKPVKLVTEGLFAFLQQAGIRTVNEELDIKKTTSINSGNIRVPSAYDEDNLEKLLDRFSKEGAEVELVFLKGKKYLQIKVDSLVRDHEDFNGGTDSSNGPLLRVAAVIAHVLKIEHKILGFDEKNVYEINITPSEQQWGDKNSFHTPIQINTFDRRSRPEFMEFADNSTYLLLSGDEINSMKTPNRLEQLIERFLELCEAVKAKLPSRGKKDRKAQSPAEKARASLSRVAPAQSISRTSIGQTPLDRGGAERGYNEFVDPESIMPPGYYVSGVGTEFVYDGDAREARWSNSETWEKVDIPKKVPRKVQSKVVVRGLSGAARLNVLQGTRIAGYETVPANAQVEFLRDVRTGVYSVLGYATKLVYCTEDDKESSHFWNPPLPEEKESPVDLRLLQPELAKFIREVSRNRAFTVHTKVQLAMAKWQELFKYSDDDALHEQVKGSSTQEIAARIFSTGRGICNISATGLALLLRALGLPTRVYTGLSVQDSETAGSHMWTAYWNNTRWVPIESLSGVENMPDTPRPPLADKPMEISSKYSEKGEKNTSVSSVRAAVYAAVLAILTGLVVHYADAGSKPEKPKEKDRTHEVEKNTDTETGFD